MSNVIKTRSLKATSQTSWDCIKCQTKKDKADIKKMKADETIRSRQNHRHTQRVKQEVSHQRRIYQNKIGSLRDRKQTWLKTTHESNKEQGTKANLK